MDHWTKFRILTCKCLTLGAPSSNTLIPPWSSYPCLPSALSIFSISSFSLSLSPSNENGFTCTFKCKNGYSVHSASLRSESTRFFSFREKCHMLPEFLHVGFVGLNCFQELLKKSEAEIREIRFLQVARLTCLHRRHRRLTGRPRWWWAMDQPAPSHPPSCPPPSTHAGLGTCAGEDSRRRLLPTMMPPPPCNKGFPRGYLYGCARLLNMAVADFGEGLNHFTPLDLFTNLGRVNSTT